MRMHGALAAMYQVHQAAVGRMARHLMKSTYKVSYDTAMGLAEGKKAM